MRDPRSLYTSPSNASDGEIVARYASLIDRVGRRLAAKIGSHFSADELWSAGALGLLEAARRFDGARDVKFETFAEHRIRGAMLDELRKLDHLPRRLRSAADEVEKARKKLSHRLGREPTSPELAEETGIEIEEVDSLIGLNQPPLPLLVTMDAAGEDPLPDEQAARTQTREKLTGAISKLPERLQILLSLHYVEGLSYREISQVMHISEPRVCQLHAEAVAKLKGQMAGGESAA